MSNFDVEIIGDMVRLVRNGNPAPEPVERMPSICARSISEGTRNASTYRWCSAGSVNATGADYAEYMEAYRRRHVAAGSMGLRLALLPSGCVVKLKEAQPWTKS